MRRSDTICETHDPQARTELLITFAHEEPDPAQKGVTDIYHLTIQSGAMIQQTTMVTADIPVGGGLIAPYFDNSGLRFFAESETAHIVPDSMSDLYETGAWDRSMWDGYTALMLDLLR